MRAIPHIYLCGPITNSEDDGIGWRETARKEYSHMASFFDPVDRINGKDENIGVVPSKDDRYRLMKEDNDYDRIVTDSHITTRDKAEIRKSEGLVVNHEEVISRGTDMEIMYAWERDKEIALWSEYDVGEIDTWLRDHVHLINDDLEECVSYIEEEFAYNEYANE